MQRNAKLANSLVINVYIYIQLRLAHLLQMEILIRPASCVWECQFEVFGARGPSNQRKTHRSVHSRCGYCPPSFTETIGSITSKVVADVVGVE